MAMSGVGLRCKGMSGVKPVGWALWRIWLLRLRQLIRCFHGAAKGTRLAVMPHIRFPLSPRQVVDQEVELFEVIAAKRRNRQAALRLLKRAATPAD